MKQLDEFVTVFFLELLVIEFGDSTEQVPSAESDKEVFDGFIVLHTACERFDCGRLPHFSFLFSFDLFFLDGSHHIFGGGFY